MSRRGRKSSSGYDKSVYRALMLLSQFGINMLVPICVMSAPGIWLDKRFDTSWWTVVLFFAGALSGGQNVYRMARQIFEKKSDEEQRPADENHRNSEKQE